MPETQENIDIAEYLSKTITSMVNAKVRTLETIIQPNKKASDEAKFNNGASNGTRVEKYCVEFALMCIHETEIISAIEKWCA